MKEEFEAIDAPPFEERGAVGNEYLRVFKELWTSDNPSFDGDYCSFSDISFAPKPVQRPHPPLWIGGESPARLETRRTARRRMVSHLQQPPVPGRHIRPAGRLHVPRARTRPGRRDETLASLDFAYSVNWNSDTEAQGADGERLLLTGSPTLVSDDIKRLEEMGVNHLTLTFQGSTLEETFALLDRFAEDVKPLAR